MDKKLVALDLLNTILSKVYTKITNETNEKIELATKGYDDTFIPLTQKAAANGVATLDANGHVPVEQIVDTTDETGDEFDYLSINDTGFEWKSRVHNDYTNANPNNLIDSDTLRNYNGQWTTGEPEPTGRMVPPYTMVFESEEYSGIPDNEWTVLRTDPMDFSTRPELHKVMNLKAKITDYGRNRQALETYYKLLSEISDWETYLVTKRGWVSTTEGNATVYTAPYTTDDGWIEVVYGANDEDSNYVLINKVSIDSGGNFSAYQNDTIVSSNINLCIYRDRDFRVGGMQITGTVEIAPATTANPITKLGVVDEGTWVAGDVMTPNLVANSSTVLNTTTTINDDLHITEDVIDFGGVNYDVWDYANDNMNWVEE